MTLPHHRRPARGRLLLIVSVLLLVGALLAGALWQLQGSRREGGAMAGLRTAWIQVRADVGDATVHVSLGGAEAEPWQTGRGVQLLAQTQQQWRLLAPRLADTQSAQAFEQALNEAVQLADRPGASATLRWRLVSHELLARADAVQRELLQRSIHLEQGQADAQGRVLALGALELLLLGVGVALSQRQRRAREAEVRLLSRVVEQVPHAVMVTDLDQVIRYVNPAFERLTGYGPAEALGQPARMLSSGHTPADDLSRLREAVARGQDCELSFHNRTRDGRVRIHRALVAPIRDAQGQVHQHLAILQDVTEQMKLDQELAAYRLDLERRVAERTMAMQAAIRGREEAAQFAHQVADNIPGRVAYWSRELECRFVNRVYCEWVGRPREALLGRRMPDLFGEDDMALRQPHLAAVLAGQARSFEREGSRPDGSREVVAVSYVPDLDGDTVLGFFMLATDITALRSAEEGLRELNADLGAALARAEAASRAKSAFLANMSHEIRTPMSAIIGLSYLLQRDNRDPTQQDRLAKVSDAAQHLLHVINDILDLSKIESGKLTLEQADFSLEALLAKVSALVGGRAQDKGLELVLDAAGVPDGLRGDATRLSQALLNLTFNAVKFTEQGCVVVHAERLAEDARGLHIAFEVRDTGIGIAPEEIDRIFDPFVQADSSSNRRHGGSGLGLAITRRLAELMGGSLSVRSRPGQGSCFRLEVCLQRGLPAPEHAAPPLRDQRVLLVDDRPEALQAIGDLLGRLGLKVDAASSGADALTQARDGCQRGQPPRLALIDWQMPGLDGFETLRALREQPGLSGLPAVLVSAHEADALRESAVRAGFDGVLSKPVQASALQDCLATVWRAAGPSGAAPATDEPGLEQLVRRRHGGARVLLAEDNLINQEVALELLHGAGLVVDVADDGAQALARAEAGRYDLVLMDMQMPGMDGLQATRAIRALPAHGDTPILAMTANAFSEDREACLAAGMDDHVGKPVDPPTLYAALLRWLPGRPAGRG